MQYENQWMLLVERGGASIAQQYLLPNLYYFLGKGSRVARLEWSFGALNKLSWLLKVGPYFISQYLLYKVGTPKLR